MNYSRSVPSLLSQANRIAAERSYYEFVKQAWHVLNPSQKFVGNWHIEFICNELQSGIELLMQGIKPQDLIINVPPGSSKSTIGVIMLAPWVWIRWKSFAMLGVSYSDDLASKHSRESRQIVTSSWYQENWGDKVQIKKDQSQKSDFEIVGQGRRYAAGIKGSITGQHFDLVITDDPHNPKEAESDAQRETANGLYSTTLQSRVKNPSLSWFVIVMQRLHVRDLTGVEITKSPNRYKHVCIPALSSKKINPSVLIEKYTDGCFFPARFPKSYLENLRDDDIGPTIFNAQYLQEVSNPEGEKIKKWWFTTFDPNDPQIAALTMNFVADTAFGEDAEKRKSDGISDFSATVAFKVFKGRILLHGLQHNKLPANEWLKKLAEWVFENQYDPGASAIGIEKAATGDPVIRFAKEGIEIDGQKHYLNIMGIKRPSASKEVRMNAQLGKWETQKIQVPLGPVRYEYQMPDGSMRAIMVQPWVPALIEEITGFPKATHDDITDACMHAVERYLMGTRLYPDEE